jgi:uncharacterized protein DUF6220
VLLRNIHRYLLSIFTLGVIVQFFLAGLGVFKVTEGASGNRFDHVFAPHRALGNTLFVVAVVVLVVAVAARLSRPRLVLSVALPVLVFLQSVLANNGPSWFRAIHPVNAVLILALAGSFTGTLWREYRTASAG